MDGRDLLNELQARRAAADDPAFEDYFIGALAQQLAGDLDGRRQWRRAIETAERCAAEHAARRAEAAGR